MCLEGARALGCRGKVRFPDPTTRHQNLGFEGEPLNPIPRAPNHETVNPDTLSDPTSNQTVSCFGLCLCMCIYIYTLKHLCECMHLCLRSCMYVCTCINACIYVQVYTIVYIHIYAYVCIYAYIYAYIHAHIYIVIYTCISPEQAGPSAGCLFTVVAGTCVVPRVRSGNLRGGFASCAGCCGSAGGFRSDAVGFHDTLGLHRLS